HLRAYPVQVSLEVGVDRAERADRTAWVVLDLDDPDECSDLGIVRRREGEDHVIEAVPAFGLPVELHSLDAVRADAHLRPGLDLRGHFRDPAAPAGRAARAYPDAAAGTITLLAAADERGGVLGPVVPPEPALAAGLDLLWAEADRPLAVPLEGLRVEQVAVVIEGVV